jgi:hypothetical protein
VIAVPLLCLVAYVAVYLLCFPVYRDLKWESGNSTWFAPSPILACSSRWQVVIWSPLAWVEKCLRNGAFAFGTLMPGTPESALIAHPGTVF